MVKKGDAWKNESTFGGYEGCDKINLNSIKANDILKVKKEPTDAQARVA